MLDDLDIVEVGQLLLGDALLLVDVAGAVAGGHGDGAQLQQLLNGVDGHIAGARDSHPLALQADQRVPTKQTCTLLCLQVPVMEVLKLPVWAVLHLHGGTTLNDWPDASRTS